MFEEFDQIVRRQQRGRTIRLVLVCIFLGCAAYLFAPIAVALIEAQ